MDIEALRTFVEVADAGGVSAAARRLGVSKSIVSRQLAQLEAELGVQLLARNTRGAALTEAGLTFRDHAARACAEIDLIAEGFDCAIRVGYLQDSNLIARCVGPIHGKFVASPAYIDEHGAPETPDDLLAHQALMQGVESWQLTEGDKIVTIHPQGRFKADNGSALLAAALAGLGIAWLPDGITDEHVSSGALVPVLTRHLPPPAGVYVVRPPSQHLSRKVRVLTELLIECFDHGAQAQFKSAL